MRRAIRAWSLPVMVALALPAVARAQAISFSARTDRTTVGLNETLTCEVTLALPEGRASGYTAPTFRGFDVLSESPSQSTQFRLGGGATFSQTTYTWRYQLRPQKKGIFTFGPARVQAGGRDLATSPLTVTVTDPVAVPSAPATPRAPSVRQRFGFGFPFPDPFADADDDPAPAALGGENFLRAIPSRTRAFVGEPITVEWRLYLIERQDRYQALAEPRADGFWVEDIPVLANRGGLALSTVEHEGRIYQVAPLLKKILFPLRAGKQTITPLAAEIARVDLFGAARRAQKLESEALSIDVAPLPTRGRPDGFDDTAVGKFTITAHVDRAEVRVGEAITLSVVIAGRGNLRKLIPPRVPSPPGAKIYEPKVDVTFDPETAHGEKRVEILLLPERAGPLVIPAIALPYFDPETGAYATASTDPIEVRVTDDGSSASVEQSGGAVTAAPGAENVIGADVRPIRGGAILRRTADAALYQRSWFPLLVAAPPCAYVLAGALAMLRARGARDSEPARRRRLRRVVRTRLAAAERHRAAGRTAPFAAEIERVLHEILTARLGVPAQGLARDELAAALVRAGLARDTVDAVGAELDACDRVRFAPGAADAPALAAALERASELIARLENAPEPTART